jgi:hypothetical protein
MRQCGQQVRTLKLCPPRAKANPEVVTTPLFKLYQTKRPCDDGSPNVGKLRGTAEIPSLEFAGAPK